MIECCGHAVFVYLVTTGALLLHIQSLLHILLPHIMSCLLLHPLSYRRVRDPRRLPRSPAGPRNFFALGLLPRLAYPLPCSKNSMKWIGRKVAAGWWAPQGAAAGAGHMRGAVSTSHVALSKRGTPIAPVRS